jgi:hypothetical protein
MATTSIPSFPTTSMYTPIILTLRAPYESEGSYYYQDDALIMAKEAEIETNTFIGSSTSVSLHSFQSSILYDAPGCLAAPVVNLIAQKSIRLGSHERSPYSPYESSLKLFATNILHIKTEHLIIGNMQLLAPPFAGVIICSKLTIINFSQEAASSLLAIIRKYLDNPAATSIEIVEPALQLNLS